ncbi:hypothetical protein GGR50DRAFT_418284 [Xylaria sp. CBS 124048]|nr:hypothetical protein GGR50DRAFT_418284 [Xylaria sp. CBS 124048]
MASTLRFRSSCCCLQRGSLLHWSSGVLEQYVCPARSCLARLAALLAQPTTIAAVPWWSAEPQEDNDLGERSHDTVKLKDGGPSSRRRTRQSTTVSSEIGLGCRSSARAIRILSCRPQCQSPRENSSWNGFTLATGRRLHHDLLEDSRKILSRGPCPITALQCGSHSSV